MDMIVNRKYFGSDIFDKVYCELIQAARNKQLITYGEEIAKIMGLPSSGNYMARKTGQILGEISEYEHLHSRPLLSAVVVRGDKNIPGKGFFTLARELGELQEGMDERSFWERELEEVYDTWS
jgi:alkylated DNA nucleotide flippase Atl1